MNDLQVIQHRVIKLMMLLGFNVHHCTLPKLVIKEMGNVEGQYNCSTHTIFISDKLQGIALESTLAHELVHSLQNSNSWDMFCSYYKRPHEIEAYAVQDLYNLHFTIPALSPTIRFLQKYRKPAKFAAKWIRHTEERMASDPAIRNHSDLGGMFSSIFDSNLPMFKN